MIESWFARPVNTETHQTTSSRRSQRRLCNRLLGLAIPDAPVQALDLLDDHRFRRSPGRIVSQQGASDLLQVLQPHGDVKPVEHRRRGDAGVGQNTPEPRTAVGEGGQRRIGQN